MLFRTKLLLFINLFIDELITFKIKFIKTLAFTLL